MKRALLVAVLLTGCAHGKAATGVLVMRLAPHDARVLIDGEYVGSAGQLSGHRLRMHVGVHRVEVGAEGYYAARREADITRDGNVELQVQLHAVPEGERGN
jgi:PEGA domain